MPKAFFALALLCAVTRSVSADTANFSSQNFRPSPHGDSFFSVESGAIDPSIEVKAGLFLDYEYRPLQLYTPQGKRLSGLLDHRLSATVLGSVTFFDRLSVGLLVPTTLYETNDPKTAQVGVHAAEHAAFGDLRIEPKVGILDQAHHYIDLAVLLDLTLPTATRHSYAGDSTVSAGGELDISHRFGAFRLAGNFGFQWRTKQSSFDLQIGPELYYRFGGGFDLGRIKRAAPVEIIGEIYGRTSAITPFRYGTQNPIEWVIGLKWSPLSWLALNLGGGRAINAGYGAPAARVFLGAMFTPLQASAKQGELDSDGDGIPDRLDRCPTEAEDKDGFEDDDGCPDLDNDKDGIPDKLDKCPNDPEDFDGFQDEDGCPDPDNDKDGIPDTIDKCPNDPEDMDGFQDEDGCPDPDNDNDGIPDVKDKCPNLPEDFDGFQDEDGCPDPDNDNDGILDSLDKCPNQPETINGFEDYDGCPDKGPSLVVLTVSGIDIKEKVYFETASDKVLAKSFNLLNQVAAVLKNHAEIQRVRVEGHTDNVGEPGTNLRLSQRRADSVRAYLIAQRVDPTRLVSVGFGESKPIASNGTARGREQNRRVAFLIVRDAPQTIEVNAPQLVPVKPEPKKVEPAKPEPKKAEPKKVEPAKPEPKKAEPKKVEPTKPEPKKAEPTKPEPKKAEPKKAEPRKVEPKKPEPKTVTHKKSDAEGDDPPPLVMPKASDDTPPLVMPKAKKKGVQP